jgi:hypothetical protein
MTEVAQVVLLDLDTGKEQPLPIAGGATLCLDGQRVLGTWDILWPPDHREKNRKLSKTPSLFDSAWKTRRIGKNCR